MIQLPTKSGKPYAAEHIVRIVLLAAMVWGGLKLYNAMAPTIIKAAENTWMLLAIGGPLLFIVLYVLSNPSLVWMGYKTICRKITSLFIKMDPLSFMDRYVDVLTKKKGILDTTRTTLSGKKEKLERKMKELLDNVRTNLKYADSASRSGNNSQASLYGTKISADKQSVQLYEPIYNRMKANQEFLDELSENWGVSIEKLRYEIERKREEYEMIKETAKACQSAEDFTKVTESKNIYMMSVKALEESVTQKIAYIDQFQKDSKSIMSGLKTEKSAMQEEGLSILEQYRHDGKLLLPSDYSTLNKFEDIGYETVAPIAKYGL